MLGCPWRTCLCLFANSVATRGDSKSSSCRMSNRGIVPSLGTAHEAQDQESQTSNCTGCQMRVCHMTKLCQSDGVSRVSCASSLEIRRGCMSKDIPTGIGLRALLAVQFTLWYCTLQARLNIGSAAAKDTSGKLGRQGGIAFSWTHLVPASRYPWASIVKVGITWYHCMVVHPQTVPTRCDRRFDQHSTADVLEKIAGLSGQVATKALVTAMIRGVFGCEAKELSWLHFLHYIACAGGLERLVTIKKGFQEHTVLGGAQQISERLAKEVRSLGGKLEFNCKVTSVTTEADGVWVACGESKSFRCLRCVFATPPKQLGNVKFAPALPSSRAALHTSVFIGCIIKAVFRYGRPFWRLNGFSGEVVAEATDDEPCFNCYDHCVGDCHMLVCFLNGSPARTWSLRTQDERRQVLLKQLTKWFGPEASHPLEYLEKDWAADEFTGGCPVGVAEALW
ncbi:unnamed protein product [Durusdinium trenchii]|uniref:monoamine oxidase n=1 Tax=Durusdinium trenchii TaxID=1381693 RepID=A0ABP0IYF6_9DINO